MRRKGGAGAAAVTAPGAVKPQSNIVYEAIDAEAVVVAVFTKVNRPDLDDVPGLMADLQNNALQYDVLHAVEALLVAEITGTTGLLAPDVSADGNVPDKLLSAVGALTATGVQPNFVALNPPGRDGGIQGARGHGRRLHRRVAVGQAPSGRAEPRATGGRGARRRQPGRRCARRPPGRDGVGWEPRRTT